jgi:hypothetical protein
MKDFEEIQTTKRAHSFSLLCKRGVLGVGLGKKEVRGQATEAMSIKILVEKKIRASLLPTSEITHA